LLPISDASFGALAAGLLVATAIDLRTRRIPNVVTALMAAAGIALAVTGASGLSLAAVGAGVALGLCLMMPGHLLGATGAGDVKLMGAVGALLGPGLIVRAFLFTALAGGVLALLVAARRGRLATTIRGTAHLVAQPSDAPHNLTTAGPGRRFAYGPAIAVGSLLAAVMG
jgi:prepilin peptidase CpaA